MATETEARNLSAALNWLTGDDEWHETAYHDDSSQWFAHWIPPVERILTDPDVSLHTPNDVWRYLVCGSTPSSATIRNALVLCVPNGVNLRERIYSKKEATSIAKGLNWLLQDTRWKPECYVIGKHIYWRIVLRENICLEKAIHCIQQVRDAYLVLNQYYRVHSPLRIPIAPEVAG